MLQHVLPKDAVSSVVYRIARSHRTWIRDPLIRWFASAYRVDLSDAEHSDLARYSTFNDFFTRALAPNARPLAGDERTVVSPVDGMLTEFGTLDGDRMLQAKGAPYSLTELLGETGADAHALQGGSYATLYLAPHNYHRVHLPLAASLRRVRYVPGRRFAVNRATVAVVPRLLCRNERAACWFDTRGGTMVVVLIGALNVSSISTFDRGEIASGRPQHWAVEPPRALQRGAEIGRFNLGSTVVLLFAPGTVRWNEGLDDGDSVLMGAALGRLVEHTESAA